jgi:hypothetical protein
MSGWPTAPVSTTNTDAGTDSPASARTDLQDAVSKLNQVIAHGEPLSLAGGALTGPVFEAKSAVTAANLDLTLAGYFAKTVAANTAFTVSGVPAAGSVASFVLDITNGGAYTVTWWAGLKWPGGLVPTLTAAGRDVLAFYTHDGGTTWNGFVLGRNMG